MLHQYINEKNRQQNTTQQKQPHCPQRVYALGDRATSHSKTLSMIVRSRQLRKMEEEGARSGVRVFGAEGEEDARF